MFRTPGVTATGDVILEASVDSKGEVTDARVLSGPVELRRSALQSVVEWHFSTDQALPPVVRVTIHFGEAANPTHIRGGLAGGIRGGIVGGISSVPPPGSPMTIGSILVHGVTPDVEQTVLRRISAHVGDLASPELMIRVTAVARQIDEHLQVTLRQEFFAQDTATLAITIADEGAPSLPPPSFNRTTVAAPAAGRMVVDPEVQAANLITKINPAYPPLAKQARIQGTVLLNATIGTDGAIQNLQVISGHPLLVPAALEAVKQWVYKPTLQNGKPVEVVTRITVNFTLSE